VIVVLNYSVLDTDAKIILWNFVLRESFITVVRDALNTENSLQNLYIKQTRYIYNASQIMAHFLVGTNFIIQSTNYDD